MAQLILTELTARDGDMGFSELSGSASGKRIALVGDWAPLMAVLAGRSTPSHGKASIDEQLGRQAVIEGYVGIVDATLQPLPGRSVAQWLALYARLRGFSRDDAPRTAEETLTRLGLGYLARYKTDDVPGPALYGARAALASLTQPRVLVLDPPPWSAQSQALSHALLEQLGLCADLIVRCDPSEQPELFCSCEAALITDGRSVMSVIPSEYLSTTSRTYRVRALSHREEFAAALNTRGAKVSIPTDSGEFWVTLPAGSGTELVVKAALQSRAGLERMSPLFELPTAG